MTCALTRLETGMPIVWGGDRVSLVPEALAAAFAPGDRLLVMQDTGDLLRIPAAAHRIAGAAVERARDAFAAMARVDDEAITRFFETFAANLEVADDLDRHRRGQRRATWPCAKAKGRGVTRLVATDGMRAGHDRGPARLARRPADARAAGRSGSSTPAGRWNR